MNGFMLRSLSVLVGVAMLAGIPAGVHAEPRPEWQVVVNNGDVMPTDLCDPSVPSPQPSCRLFNSYNPPSVNAQGLVVLRARSRGGQGGGQHVHGVYARDMSIVTPVTRILDNATPVPQPNNRGTTFIEPPSFPRIDIASPAVVARGNHQPVWQVLAESGEVLEQLGTTGIYANAFGALVTVGSKLGTVSAFSFFQVPEAPGTPFDVFPGAPSVTDGGTVVFKGNYTVGLASKTGVYYRSITNASLNGGPGAGTSPVMLIANSATTRIPGTGTVFGSTAPPSAAAGHAVFAGFDNEDAPTIGGIYLAPLSGPEPPLTTLVSIGSQVPGEGPAAGFRKLSEALAFDGRFVAFWGTWGTDSRTLVLQCPTEGNAARIAFCNTQHPQGFAVQVPVHQGIFVHDIRTGQTRVIARTPNDFDDFQFWSFSGRVPGSGESDEDGELARWRASAFVAVSGLVNRSLKDPNVHVAFKARTAALVAGAYTAPVDGIYLGKRAGNGRIATLLETGMDGRLLDPEAVDELGNGLSITEVGIERDGLRGRFLVINARMGSEETGWAGIYLTDISR